jgi:GTP cyclohydrolase I
MKTNFNSDTLELHDQIGDEHILTSIETPMLATAFDKTDAEKIDEIAVHFQAIMET